MADETLFEVRTIRPSLLMRLGAFVVKKGPKIFPREPADVATFLQNRTLPVGAPMPARFRSRFQVEEWQAEGQRCITLHPRAGKGRHHILYFHGGGFVLPNVKQHWDLLAGLVDVTGASVTAALYDLVPEHPAAHADRLADAAFVRICEEWEAGDVALCGDSAGGHIALSLALRQARSGAVMPGHLALFAPWLDVTMQDPAMQAVAPHDFMLAIEPLRMLGSIWAEDRDPGASECSPLYTDDALLAKLPPTRIFTGQHDLFIIDSRTFTRRLADAGVDARLYEYAGAPHVFMALAVTREAKDVFALLRDFLNR